MNMGKAIEIIKNVLENSEFEDNWKVEIDEDFDDEIVIYHENYYSGDEKQTIIKEIQHAFLKRNENYPHFFFERK